MSESLISCLECKEPIDSLTEEDVTSGDILTCNSCGREMEVMGTEPLELDYLLLEK